LSEAKPINILESAAPEPYNRAGILLGKSDRCLAIRKKLKSRGETMAKILSTWFSAVLSVLITASLTLAASVSPPLLKAKKDADAQGYIFETSRDEIVAKAKKEAKLRVLSTMEIEVTKALRDAFKKKYPFIDIRAEELGSVDENQRFLLEIKAGAAKGWDVNRVYTDFYEEFLPYQKKFDILGMAEHKVLNIPPPLVDPRTRNVVTSVSNMNVVAYNKKLLAPDKVPEKWEDFLKPEFKGRKFVTDIRPVPFAILVPAWGLEKTLDFARKLAAQDPVWGRGHTRMISSVINGDVVAVAGTNLGSAKKAQQKDRVDVLGMKIIEPVPIRLHEGNSVLNSAEYPYAGLLWLEFQASPEGQKIIDQHWPLGASILLPGSAQEELTRGKKLSLADWQHMQKVDDYLTKIVEALGFPKAK
jgi:ABC-type Fe3+ transport system substrate-binding protein